MPALTERGRPRIEKVDIAGVKSIIEALRSEIADAENVLIESVQKAQALSVIRNETVQKAKNKYGIRN